MSRKNCGAEQSTIKASIKDLEDYYRSLFGEQRNQVSVGGNEGDQQSDPQEDVSSYQSLKG